MARKPEPKQFSMIRRHDESGVSGRGRVLDGIVFHNGKVVVCWRTERIASSITFFDSFEDFKKIHIDAHPVNRSIIEWKDDKILTNMSKYDISNTQLAHGEKEKDSDATKENI